MSLLIDLTPDEEAAIRADAAKQGMDVSAFVREKLFPVSESDTPADTQAMTAFLERVRNRATRAARAGLHVQGIGYVVGDETGAVIERLPDGTANVLQAPAR